MADFIGWVSSVVLILTLTKQVYKQWQEGSSKNVSKWLFIGQMVSSVGFIIYSALLENWIFIITNILILVSAVAGGLIVLKHRRREQPSDRLPNSVEHPQLRR